MLTRITKELYAYGHKWPAGTIFYQTDGLTFIADRFPNYKGDCPTVMRLWCYDPLWDTLESDLYGGEIVRRIWDYYVARGKRKPDHTTQTGEYSALMRHERRHKKGSGGAIGNAETVTDYECVGVGGRAVKPEKYWHDRKAYDIAM